MNPQFLGVGADSSLPRAYPEEHFSLAREERMEPVIERISRARGAVLSVAPYFARGLFRLRFEEDATVPTMAVTPAFRVKYNPAFVVEKLTEATLAGVIAHELGHCIGLHHARMGERTAVYSGGFTVWNVATDVLVNDSVREIGLSLPDGAVTREGLKVPEHLVTAEDVYYWLLQRNEEEGGGGGGSFGEGDGGDLQAGGPGEEMEGDEGMLAKQVAADVKEYASRHPGKVPGGLEMWADSVLARPKIRWQDVLRSRRTRALASWVAGNENPTFGRRSRRQDAVGGREFVLPGRFKPVPLTVVIVDMSGSMSDRVTGSAVLTSVGGILEAAGGKTVAITCDTAAQVLGPISSAREIVAKGRHGGGTDMAPAFEEARKMRAACIVCITDGYLPPVPDEAIWLITPGGARQDWMRGIVLQYD